MMNPLRNIVVIGNGTFSKFIQNNVLVPAGFKVEDIITSSTADKIHSLKDKIVYVASPDALHNSHAEALINNNHVLCEKPVTNIEELINLFTGNKVFHINFHRRKVHSDLLRVDGVKDVLIRSWDPVPNHADYKFVVNNSLSHDMDLLSIINNDVNEWHLVSVDTEEDTSIEIVLKTGDTNVRISYKKNHSSYVQEIITDGKLGGFDFEVIPGFTPFHAYTDAYIAKFKEFFHAIDSHDIQSNKDVLKSYLFADKLGKKIISVM